MGTSPLCPLPGTYSVLSMRAFALNSWEKTELYTVERNEINLLKLDQSNKYKYLHFRSLIMLQFLLTWLATAVSLIVTAFIVPGFAIVSFSSAVVGAAILGLVNAVVKPILVLFTLPLTILTLGLFLLVVNAIALGLVSYLTPGFTITGFFPAVFGSIVLTIVSGLVNQLFPTADSSY